MYRTSYCLRHSLDSNLGAREMNPRISMITLGVSNFERSLAFYRDGLGFPLKDGPENIAFFDLNGSWLSLYSRDLLAAHATVAAEGQGFAGFALAHNVASESLVDQTLASALDAGATLVKPAQKVEWGGYSGYFSDPDGFLWEIAHNPFMWIGPVDEQGR